MLPYTSSYTVAEVVSELTGVKEDKLTSIRTLADLRERYELLDITPLQKHKIETFYALNEVYLNELRGVGDTIRCSKDVYNLLSTDLENSNQEHFVVISLNTKNKVLNAEVISKGSLNNAIVHPREVYKEAILNSAHTIIVAHNHPSGDVVPSQEDINISKRLKDAGEIVGINLVDHVIIGKNDYASMREMNLL